MKARQADRGFVVAADDMPISREMQRAQFTDTVAGGAAFAADRPSASGNADVSRNSFLD